MRFFMMGKRGIIFFLKIYTFLVILCIKHYRNDVSSLCRTLDNTNKIIETSVVRFDRILAKHEALKNLKHSKLGEKNTFNGKNKNIKDKQDNTPRLMDTKKDELNELDSYMQSYEHRYAKRKGLGKLECSCEKKIFDAIDKIDKAGKSDNKKMKKEIHSKYGVFFVTTCLIPLLGVILPVLDKIEDVKSALQSYISKDLTIIPSVLFILFTYIILALIIYIMIKIVKYEKLKDNKGKMSFNEYCGFCKDVFSKK